MASGQNRAQTNRPRKILDALVLLPAGQASCPPLHCRCMARRRHHLPTPNPSPPTPTPAAALPYIKVPSPSASFPPALAENPPSPLTHATIFFLPQPLPWPSSSGWPPVASWPREPRPSLLRPPRRGACWSWPSAGSPLVSWSPRQALGCHRASTP